ncbi:MAG TPA: hypothetical protein VGC79_12410 [Polyangiaceae bacterium]
MLKSNQNAANRRFRAGSVVASALCGLLGAGLGCSSDPDPGIVGGPAGAAGVASSSGGSTAQSGGPAGGASSGSAGKANGNAGAANGGASASSGGMSSGGSPPIGQAGGPAMGGGGGGVMAAAGAGGGSSTGGCTRDSLKAAIDSYFKALALHDPSMLPLADTLRFTENGKESKPADAPLWKTAGTLKYAHSALDTDLCMSATEAVVPDGTTDIPVAVRLRLVNQKITEIETIAARKGDYTGVTSNTAALAASKDTIKWEEAVSADKRNTYAELTAWMTKYFKQFPAGVCNTTSTCKRMENGGGNFVCGEGASCAASSSSTVLTPHLVMADVETGLGVGFTLFTGGHPDMHMFKMYGGQVYAVSAILSKGDSTGWE